MVSELLMLMGNLLRVMGKLRWEAGSGDSI